MVGDYSRGDILAGGFGLGSVCAFLENVLPGSAR